MLVDCYNTEDKSDCFYDTLGEYVFEFIQGNRKVINFAKKDTLWTGGRIVLNSNGQIDFNRSSFSIRAQDVNERLSKNFKAILKKLKIQEILNKKSSKINSSHFLDYTYVLLKNEGGISFNHISNRRKYSGSVIGEVPKFPGCEGLSEFDTRNCFKQKIQAHIRQHFRYPQVAQEQNLTGTVYTTFKMSKTGEIVDIITRGPHPILENEAKRIISLLPNVIPGKQNGEEVVVPFSIPITFSLN